MQIDREKTINELEQLKKFAIKNDMPGIEKTTKSAIELLKEKKPEELMPEGMYEWKHGDEFPGQLRMELKPAEEPKEEMSSMTKLMRFQAGQLMKLDRLNDTMCQILRAIRKE